MDNEEFIEFDKDTIFKSASVLPYQVSEDDLAKINKYALSPLGVDDVFVFKASIADNEQDDRNFMPFNLASLKDMKKLYVGKTMITDHRRTANSQIGRVFDTELIQNESKQTELGEVHTELIAKIYMVKTTRNQDLIAEIKGGIKKEVSSSTRPKKAVCNICGKDNLKGFCSHWFGEEYEGKVCKFLLDGVKDVYELSFVAVPAQPRAGTTKCFGKYEKEQQIAQAKQEQQVKEANERLVAQRLSMIDLL